MFNESPSLLQEFPEFKDQIHTLKMNDAHFARLFDEYEEVCKQVHRIEQEIDKVSDILAEKFKKQRLALKDELYSMLRKSAA
jgi:uncharacterized protein YdcH (DUF465 family)